MHVILNLSYLILSYSTSHYLTFIFISGLVCFVFIIVVVFVFTFMFIPYFYLVLSYTAQRRLDEAIDTQSMRCPPVLP